jgi:hypothetical protein
MRSYATELTSTTTSTIKRIQVNTHVTQFTPPATCSIHYITIPASLSTIINSGYPTTSYFTIPTTLRQCFERRLGLQIPETKTLYTKKPISDDTDKAMSSGLCPRYYTYAAIQTYTQYRHDRATVPPVPSTALKWQYRDEILGICCPFHHYTDSSGATRTAKWRLVDKDDFPAGTYCQTVEDLKTTRALPIWVAWYQKEAPIASSYDPEFSNYEFAFYTSWPIRRLPDPTPTLPGSNVTGLVISEIYRDQDDPDPLNWSGATTYPKQPGLNQAQRWGVVGSTLGLCILLLFVGWILWCRGDRGRERRSQLREKLSNCRWPVGRGAPNRRTARAARIGAGLARPLPPTAVWRRTDPEDVDPPPAYSQSATGSEIALESTAIRSDIPGGHGSEREGYADSSVPGIWSPTDHHTNVTIASSAPRPSRTRIEVPREPAPAYEDAPAYIALNREQ